jgi:ParB family transcriptional regulator, chromosome partitioning protein
MVRGRSALRPRGKLKQSVTSLGASWTAAHFLGSRRTANCKRAKERGLSRRSMQRHDASMRMPWNRSKVEQRDLVDEANGEPIEGLTSGRVEDRAGAQAAFSSTAHTLGAGAAEGLPLVVSIQCLEEDPRNPRTEFPEEEIAELAQDIALRGILQPIIVHPLAEDGRYRILFGAKRLRAAKQARLEAVPVVISSETHDPYAQVAENQKRHGLTAIDLARFMRSRVDAGESNAEVARRLGIDQTTVAHHLALLNLPPELDDAFKSGRCTSPRTLYELRKLHEEQPDRVKIIAAGDSAITRTSIAAFKTRRISTKAAACRPADRDGKSLVDQANALCARLESLFAQLSSRGPAATEDLAIVRRRLCDLLDR